MNIERPLCFLDVVLQRSLDVRGASNLRAGIKQRLEEWSKGKFQMLVISAELRAKSHVGSRIGVTTRNERAKVFSNIFCRGKMHSAIRHICDQEKGGVMMPENTDENAGNNVGGVLLSKHPNSRPAPLSVMPQHETFPEILEILVACENTETVAKSLSVSAGPNGLDACSMAGMLLKHGGLSGELRKSIAKLVMWLTNGYHTWDFYRAMTCFRLTGLGKFPWVRPVGIGYILRLFHGKGSVNRGLVPLMGPASAYMFSPPHFDNFGKF